MILQRLAADTHWTGDGARLEAELLATHVREVLGGNSLEPKRNYRRAETAGLIANLAFELHAPLSSVVNDGGASTLVRQELARNLEILKGKRLVIWAFAERDLRFGMKPSSVGGQAAAKGGDNAATAASPQRVGSAGSAGFVSTAVLGNPRLRRQHQ